MNTLLIISTAGLLIIVFFFFKRNIYLERRTKELIEQCRERSEIIDNLIGHSAFENKIVHEIAMDCAEYTHLLLKYAGHFPEVSNRIQKATPIPIDLLNENYAHSEDCICEQCIEKRDRRNQRTL